MTFPGQATPQQLSHFLRVLRKNNLECNLLVAFYHSTIASVLAFCISVWYSGCTAADKRALQRVSNTAQKNQPAPATSAGPKTS